MADDPVVAFDLVIRGTTVVTPGHAEAADIGIAGGRIAQLGGTMAGMHELLADGLLAIPGGVDAHTHLMHQGLGGRLEATTRRGRWRPSSIPRSTR